MKGAIQHHIIRFVSKLTESFVPVACIKKLILNVRALLYNLVSIHGKMICEFMLKKFNVSQECDTLVSLV